GWTTLFLSTVFGGLRYQSDSGQAFGRSYKRSSPDAIRGFFASPGLHPGYDWVMPRIFFRNICCTGSGMRITFVFCFCKCDFFA
ncbi:hypothetical protein, partial [Escherichia coli]